ncbi:MAG: pyruvate dehydrogenase complex E1 component subunit beta, partial [Nitrososphaerota archaeon]
FHESLNFASVKKLPLIYIVENNRYAQWTPIASQMAIESVAVRAAGYGIVGESIDGNDVLKVYETVQKSIEMARKGEGPSLIECKTYRLRRHAERIDERRSEAEIEEWKKKDPVVRFREYLVKEGIIDEEGLKRLEEDVKREIEEALNLALNDPFPDPKEILQDVYGPSQEVQTEPPKSGRVITMGDALREALMGEMERDERVFLIGEDIGADAIGPLGGLWPTTRGICAKFPDRVIGTPLSEAAIAGVAVGAALTGLRPVAEIMFADFLTLVMDQLVNYAAKMRYSYGGEASVPMVLRTVYGFPTHHLGLHHAQCVESWMMNVPGLKIVMPSTPFDAKGLLIASIRDDDPVLFLEHKLLYNVKGPVPEQPYTIPIGKADVKREGRDCTVVATGLMVHRALSAAEKLAKEGIGLEVVDPRTILPLDEGTIVESVKKTGRLVIVHEAPKLGGFGGEVAAVVAERALEYLDAPIVRVTSPFAPVPYSPPLEEAYLPHDEDIIKAVKRVLSGS